MIDTTTNTVTATITDNFGPFGVAITPDGLHAYVTNLATSTVAVIDTTANTIVATIGPASTAGPIGVAITPDGLHAYVTNDGSGTVPVIDTTTNTVVATVPVGTHPIGVAVALPPAPRSPAHLDHHQEPHRELQPRQAWHLHHHLGNNGSAATDGTAVTVQDTLPAGLTALSITGNGWRCTVSTLTCTRSSVLDPGSSYPVITLRVRVARNVLPQVVTNSVTVSGGGDGTATDPTTVDPPGPGPWHHWHHGATPENTMS